MSFFEDNQGGAAQKHPAYWQAVLAELKDYPTKDLFSVWLQPLEVVSLENKTLTLKVPSAFFQTYIRNNYEEKIKRSLMKITGQTCGLEFVVKDTGEGSQGSAGSSKSDIFPVGSSGGHKQQNAFFGEPEPTISHSSGNSPGSHSQRNILSVKNQTLNFEKAGAATTSSDNISDFNEVETTIENDLIKTAGSVIDCRHSFENFVVGAATQFAHAAARGVADNPGRHHNPLLIYGNSGLGKTHLLHAIGIHILQKNPDSKICYVSAEEFVNSFIESTQRNSVNRFQTRFRRDFDVFLIDDIQFFAGKNRSQEEFFHTFNHLCGSRLQVVMTSDKPPKELHGIEDRLITRLQQGLIVDVKPSDLETRIAILRTKAEEIDLYLPDDVALMIASNFRNNIRELEGALVRLSAEASINGVEISLEMAREALADILNNKTEITSIDAIKQAVCQYFDISMQELISKSRARKFSEPRQIAMYFCRKYANKPLQEIASIFGGKDHSTVLHGIKKIEDKIITDAKVKKQIEEIQQLL